MGYAEISVNSPIAQHRSFSYSIPWGLDIHIGHAVWIPFGEKILQGIVVELTEYPAVEETREIIGIVDSQPVLSEKYVALANWLSMYYLSPLFDAISLMLPPGFERRTLTFLSRTNKEYDIALLNPEQLRILDVIKQNKVSLKEIETKSGKKKAQKIISQLVNYGLLERNYELERVKIKPKIIPGLKLTLSPPAAITEASLLENKRAKNQASLLRFLANSPNPVCFADLRKALGTTPGTISALIKKGFVELKQIKVNREPISHLQMELSLPLSLTSTQNSALEMIKSGLSHNKPSVFLLHGVTGSGKTEIYLQALAETVRLGKRGIALVPEISLTQQTIERFAARFPNRVAVLHSQLSLGEQYDEWRRIRNGEFDVVIGPRSALFAPQPELGLIILDEEHEWTYKQTEKSPHYNARDAAIRLAELSGATVILGSATPDIETYYRAERGDYTLLSLPERVTPYEGSPLPEVEVIDLKNELSGGNLSIFSRSLSEKINWALNNQEQVLLFLNRRGGATFVQCRRCGFVVRCKRCDISMTYHPDEKSLVCHQCNYHSAVPLVCPRCNSRRIKFVGAGTQKVEEQARLAFPSARLLRWDSDVTGTQHSHADILNRFRNYEADILIGTQMIAKGLDLPRVTLVGIINADTALNLPDFRAGERTYQLLSQVAGRAGRGTQPGKVIIQTYSPQHYAIQAAAAHSYTLFYKQELAYRRELNNPPFNRLVRLVYKHTNNIRCRREAERLAKWIITERDAKGIPNLNLIGPAPAFIQKIRNYYRWQLIIRGSDPASFLSGVNLPRGWIVDVDPMGTI